MLRSIGGLYVLQKKDSKFVLLNFESILNVFRLGGIICHAHVITCYKQD